MYFILVYELCLESRVSTLVTIFSVLLKFQSIIISLKLFNHITLNLINDKLQLLFLKRLLKNAR